MEKVQAWELLNNPDYCGRLNMGEFHDLLIRAGYPAEIAQKTASNRGMDRLSAGLTM